MSARRLYVISGCSGGGKSTLIDALAETGHNVVREPGRRIIAQGGPLPWDDMAGFAQAAIAMAEADYDAARALEGPVFFDRGLVDAVLALAHATGQQRDLTRIAQRPYAKPVFFAPPWQDLFANDEDRRHGFAEALAEHDRLARAYRSLGHTLTPLPKSSVAQRVALVVAKAL
ncbi:AAA family ATPase [Gymnodinialimonas hymeniacidonis]|uniref:AAA family ATPase n=1 Tax=Gymnodinialimonas hymeniacidonis TaxID=3126508 RepID=UPI0034C6ABC9